MIWVQKREFMKWIFLTISLGLMAFTPVFGAIQSAQKEATLQKNDVALWQDAAGNPDLDQILNMTPGQYQELIGQRLTLTEKIQFRVWQHSVKKQMQRGGSIPQVLYIVLAIFGLAWIAMGVMDNWGGSTWVVNLILTLLFWLPGFIHALIVMGRYY
jgi:uncharacterized membrane protein YqaE (UPF0057 family)